MRTHLLQKKTGAIVVIRKKAIHKKLHIMHFRQHNQNRKKNTFLVFCTYCKQSLSRDHIKHSMASNKNKWDDKIKTNKKNHEREGNLAWNTAWHGSWDGEKKIKVNKPTWILIVNTGGNIWLYIMVDILHYHYIGYMKRMSLVFSFVQWYEVYLGQFYSFCHYFFPFMLIFFL